MPKDPIFLLERRLPGRHPGQQGRPVRGASIAAALVALLALFFQKTATGRALRAVADDHQAAQSIGIPLNRIWVIVWSVAGFVALVAGMIWGSKLGVQFSLSLVALKALPVVILGGLTSVPGAIIGGLIIGVGEKLSEVYIGPMLRRRHRDLVRLRAGAAVPARPAAGAVRREDHRSRLRSSPRHATARPTCMIYRENGQFKTSYRADQQIFPILQDRIVDRRCCSPSPSSSCRCIAPRVPVPRDPDPVPDPVAGRARPEHPGRLLRPDLARHRRLHGGRRLRGLQLHGPHRRHAADRCRCCSAGSVATAVGVLFGIPSLRIKGLYLAVATLAAQFFVDWAFLRDQVVHQRLVARARSASAAWRCSGCRSRRRRRSTCSAWRFVVRVRAAGEEPGARRTSAASGWRCATWTSPPQ